MKRALLIGAGAIGILAAAYAAHQAELVDLHELEAAIEDAMGLGPLAAELGAIGTEPNVGAFLQMIRYGEGTAGSSGYRMCFGGELFDTYADHPRKAITRISGGRLITSTAAGAYQFLARTWDEVAGALGLGDFSPANQDIGAIYLIRRRGALSDVREGQFEDAVAKCGREWASLPGSPYGQPTKTLERAREIYAQAGGNFA